jgi:electron transfer flavoprotein beta subunit
MKQDGTLNRGALPAVFNHDDLYALEMGLQVKERYGGSLCAITMGPPAAAEILREALYRGADRVLLLTDRCFAGSDTLATSRVLSQAIKKAGRFDLVLCGRQALDGNTAQVGPQVAEKLGIPQLTYVDSLEHIAAGKVAAWREVEEERQLVEVALPALLTVTDKAGRPRPPSAKKIMRFRKARAGSEMPEGAEQGLLPGKHLRIEEWKAHDLAIDPRACGLPGSPTRVKKIQNVILKAREIRRVAATEEALREMFQNLLQEHTFD